MKCRIAAGLALVLGGGGGEGLAAPMPAAFANYTLDYDSPTDPALQSKVEAIDVRLRMKLGMALEHTAVGVLDLKTGRLALVRPDVIDYAASVPKIGILLAWFHEHPEAAATLAAETRREFGLMIKESNNEIAAKVSQQIGLKRIQQILGEQ